MPRLLSDGESITTKSERPETMLCIYHSQDLDGLCSAAIVRFCFPNAELFGWSYGDPIPTGLLDAADEVALVDLSFPVEIMKKYKNKLWWIDHHITAIQACQDIDIKGLRRTDTAACELTWRFFRGPEQTPLAVKYLALYDSWQHKDDGDILAFQWGARAALQSPTDATWEDLFRQVGGLFSKIQDSGYAILGYIKSHDEDRMLKASFTTKLDGHTCLAINAMDVNSLSFKSAATSEHAFVVKFYWKPSSKRWAVSVYSLPHTTVHLGNLAARYGGGGHKGAAGFEVAQLPEGFLIA